MTDGAADVATERFRGAGQNVAVALHGAFTRGYDATLVSDAHTTEDLTAYGAPAPDQVIADTNLYWSFQGAPGRTAEVATSADVRLGPDE